MKVTNNYFLPESYVKACTADDKFHKIKPATYHVTELLQPVRIIVLKRRHDNELITDASNLFNVVLGKAFHLLMEKSEKKSKDFLTEKTVRGKVSGKSIVGRIDRLKADGSELWDYKTCSKTKIKRADFEDWKKQGLIYAYLLNQKNIKCLKAHFVAFIKDYKQGDEIPPVYDYSFDITDSDLLSIETFIKERLRAIDKCKNLTDEELPECTDEEKWKDADVYSLVNKETGKTYRNFATYGEAALKLTDKYEIKIKEGVSKRCIGYCDVCQFCKNKQEVKNGSNCDDLW